MQIYMIFEILRFESRFRLVVLRNHYSDPGEAFDCLGDVSGSQFSTKFPDFGDTHEVLEFGRVQ